MPGKKKGKSGGKKKRKSLNDDDINSNDPVQIEFSQPVPQPRERLYNLLRAHPVKEKELYGMQISTKALEKLTPQEIHDLQIVFEAFDIHSRGFIGPTDVRKAMKALGFKMSREQARQMVHDAGVKTRGMIEFNEFLDIVINKQGDSKDIYDEIIQGFKLFDYDEAEKLSMDNIKHACKDAGVKFSKQELQDMMEAADLNGDGFVDKDEFIKVMLQTNLF